MSSLNSRFYRGRRCGYAIHLDAWKRYLEEGHAKSFKGIRDLWDPTNHSDSDDDDSGGEVELPEDIGKDPQRLREQNLERALACAYRHCFKKIRRNAPLEVRRYIAIPQMSMGSIPDTRFYKFGIFIPSGLTLPPCQPTERDVKVIETFIRNANRLITDDAVRERVGFTMSDVTFETFPDKDLFFPWFNGVEIDEMIQAPEMAQLYGRTLRHILGV